MSRRHQDRVRFYETLRHHLAAMTDPRTSEVAGRLYAKENMSEGPESATTILRAFDDPNCKRILFDSRQAATFAALGESPPDEIQKGLHAPFELFYLEFTEPFEFFSDQHHQVVHHRDLLHAVLYVQDSLDFAARDSDGKTGTSKLDQLTFFLSETDDDGKAINYTSQTIHYHRAAGVGLCSIEAAEMGGSEFPDDSLWFDPDHDDNARGIIVGAPGRKAGSMVVAKADTRNMLQVTDTKRDDWKSNRKIGWWEELTAKYAELFSWILTYINAKSITIQQMPMSRQRKRLHARKKGKMPEPWHIVEIEPKYIEAYGDRGEETGTGITHGYRYDVMGHLRFGKHHRKSLHDVDDRCPGAPCFSHTIEWVPPHQRGLQHTLYIPKTYKASGGKRTHPVMQEHYGISVPDVLESR